MIINKLAVILKQKGLSVCELKRRSGISLPTLYSMKNYETRFPKPHVLSKLCKTLEVSISDLIEYIPDRVEQK
jgi:DNA-binding Xre family transcriptional regulator